VTQKQGQISKIQ